MLFLHLTEDLRISGLVAGGGYSTALAVDHTQAHGTSKLLISGLRTFLVAAQAIQGQVRRLRVGLKQVVAKSHGALGLCSDYTETPMNLLRWDPRP